MEKSEHKLRKGNKMLLRITKKASIRLIEQREKENKGFYLRVGIAGGGCNGLSYRLQYTDKTKSGDILIEEHDLSVLIDPKSALYLKGSELDFSEEFINGGFKFSNPNAKSSCSCGESFSI